MPDQNRFVDQPNLSSTPADACEELNRAAFALNLAPPSEELCERLLAAVREAASQSAGSMESLRATVEEFTTSLKDEGASPEAVLITLKAVINNRTFYTVNPGETYSAGDPLRQKISTWSIKEFFREKTA